MSNPYLVNDNTPKPPAQSGSSRFVGVLLALLFIGGLVAVWKGGLLSDRSFPPEKLASLERTLLTSDLKVGKVVKNLPVESYEWGRVAVVSSSQTTRSGKTELSRHHERLDGVVRAESLERTDSLVLTVRGERQVMKGKYRSGDGKVHSRTKGLQSIVCHVFTLPDKKYEGSKVVDVRANMPDEIRVNSEVAGMEGDVSAWLNSVTK